MADGGHGADDVAGGHGGDDVAGGHGGDDVAALPWPSPRPAPRGGAGGGAGAGAGGGAPPGGALPGAAWAVDFGELELAEKVGGGGTAEVWLARWAGAEVAVKILTRMDSFRGDSPEACRDRAAFGKELTLLSTLRHPQVVSFIGASSPEWSATPLEKYCIISEFMPGGSLFERIHGGGAGGGAGGGWLGCVGARQLHSAARDTACGMAFLHSKGFIHRDLKSRNLLTDDATTFRVKVADFGLSRLRKSTMEDPSSTLSGTPAWMAPELMRGVKYGPAVDVYAYGMVLFEIISGEVPFEARYERDIHPARIVFDVVKNGLRPKLPLHASGALTRLVERCWAQHAQDRPTFVEILAELDAPGAAEALFGSGECGCAAAPLSGVPFEASPRSGDSPQNVGPGGGQAGPETARPAQDALVEEGEPSRSSHSRRSSQAGTKEKKGCVIT